MSDFSKKAEDLLTDFDVLCEEIAPFDDTELSRLNQQCLVNLKSIMAAGMRCDSADRISNKCAIEDVILYSLEEVKNLYLDKKNARNAIETFLDALCASEILTQIPANQVYEEYHTHLTLYTCARQKEKKRDNGIATG